MSIWYFGGPSFIVKSPKLRATVVYDSELIKGEVYSYECI